MSKNTSEVIAKVEQTHGLQNEIKQQAETIGAQKQNIANLIKEVEATDRKVTITEITQGTLRHSPFGELYPGIAGTKITKVNMEDAVELIAEKIDSNNEAELKDLKATLKNKVRHIEQLDQDLGDIDAKNNREIDRIRANYKEDTFQAKKGFEKSNEDLKHKVQDLKTELVKVKDDKTNELMEKTRKKEVAKLKARITTLESEMTRLLGLGFIQRWWDRITNRTARVEAIKQVRTEERSADNVYVNSNAQSYHKPSVIEVACECDEVRLNW